MPRARQSSGERPLRGAVQPLPAADTDGPLARNPGAHQDTFRPGTGLA